jgi:flagellar protein FlaI
MGLLEKTQKKNVGKKSATETDEKENVDKILHPIDLANRGEPLKIYYPKESKTVDEQMKHLGFLEKAKQRRQEGTVEKLTEEPRVLQTYTGIKAKGKSGKDVIEEKKGFGYNNQGSRKIVFNHNINEYVYEVNEPDLNENEKEKKDELSRLFKMLADVDITTMDKKSKEKYLEDTLENIIADNNFKFITEKKVEKPKKFTKKAGPKEKKEKGQKKKPVTKKATPQPTVTVKLSKEELEAAEKNAKKRVFYHIFREFLGYGKIDILMNDTGIEDISCDGHQVPIFIYHKKYDAISTNIRFDTEEELDSFVVRLSQISGKQISIYSPIVDGKLPDGSRLQTTLGKTVTKTPTFTIRKFKEKPLTPVDLIDFQSLSIEMAAYFWMAIERGASILFCGGTASGKTTALNALSLFIPSQNKIVSIEDTREVSLPHENWIAGTTREGFTASDEKTGKDIDMFDLIRAALRQRPKVIIVGEVRGREAYSLFQAMATGHTSYATVHASDIHTLIQRLENPPIQLPRALLTSLDIIVFQNAVDIGGKTVRRMTSVTEIVKLDPDTNQLIFMEPFKWVSKTEDRFESSGVSKILNNIRVQSDWTEEQISEELEKRKTILNWMLKKNIRDYKDVGRIVADYAKYPDILLNKAREESEKEESENPEDSSKKSKGGD